MTDPERIQSRPNDVPTPSPNVNSPFYKQALNVYHKQVEDFKNNDRDYHATEMVAIEILPGEERLTNPMLLIQQREEQQVDQEEEPLTVISYFLDTSEQKGKSYPTIDSFHF